MTQEKLERGKELLEKIKDYEYEIKNISKVLQTEYVHTHLTGNRKTDFYKDAIEIDIDTFIMFCKIKLSDYQTKLSIVQTEFNNL